MDPFDRGSKLLLTLWLMIGALWSILLCIGLISARNGRLFDGFGDTQAWFWGNVIYVTLLTLVALVMTRFYMKDPDRR